MINIDFWMDNFLKELDTTFGERVWFVGLQGSYARNEQSDTSDIDIVVILDKLSFEDTNAYEKMLNNLSNRELVCGFLSGKDELFNWEKSDLFQFCYDTKAYKGSLDEIKSCILSRLRVL